MIQIRIVNFDQYNPRKDRTRHYWFKVENSIIYSESLDELEADQKWFWIFLLAYAKEKQCDTFELKMKYFVKHSGVTEERIKEAIEILKKNNAIDILPSEENILETNGNQMSPNGCLDKRREEKKREEKNTEEKKREEADPNVFGPKQLAELWNSKLSPDVAVNIARLKSGSPRWESARARLRDHPEPEYWTSVIDRIAASPFCKGVNDRTWVADFEFLVRVETHIKVLEGKYDTRGSKPKTKEQQTMDHTRDQYERVLKGEL